MIPRAVRERHGWVSGTELVLDDEGDRVVLHQPLRVPETALEELVGCTGYEGPRRSLEEMEEGIAIGARKAGGSA